MPLYRPKVRTDLEYFDHEMEGETVVMVRDPVRGTYFKYNPLQAAMLRSLDGVRSLDEMVEALSAEFEVEIPRVAAERFVAHARKQMLLEVASYPVNDPKAAKKVLRELLRNGFRFHDAPDASDVVSAEAALVAAGMRQLHLGQPSQALDYFCAVLELNPQNERAKTLVTAIERAYIKALATTTSDYPTVVLFDPTRLLRFLDRTIGRLVFHRLSWLLLLGLVGLAAYCYSITNYRDLHVSALDIVLAVILTLVHFFLHELAHGFACYHYGGEVREIGIIFFYYVRPAPYCDTSSSYLFRSRGHQVGVQMAGAILSVIFCCLLFLLLAVIHPNLFIYQAGQLILWISVILTFVDFVPFTKFDGYYALCDYMGLPNLRERSIRLLTGWLGRRLLGLPATEEELSPGKRLMFFGFAVCSILFTGWWVYQGVFRLLAPIVEKFRGLGLVIAMVLLFYLLRNRLLYPLGRLVWLALRERRQIFTLRRSVWLVAIAAALVAPWLIQRPVRVDADLVLVPSRRVEIRAQAPGLVDRVLVREGDAVTAGQPLVVLRNADLERDLQVTEAELARVDAELAALRRGARPEAIAFAGRRLDMTQATRAQKARRAELAGALAQGGLGTDAAAAAAAGSAAVSRSLAEAARWNLATLEAGSRPEDIAAAEARRSRLAAQLDHVRAERERLTLRSPIDGVIATKHLEDRRSAHLERGDRIAEVHDTSSFVAEIRLGTGAPLDELGAGDAIALRTTGAPGEDIRCAIARIRDAVDAAGTTGVPGASDAPGPAEVRDHPAAPPSGDVIAVTTPFPIAAGHAGMIGHARLYGARRSLAYSELYLPLQRVLRVKLWSLM